MLSPKIIDVTLSSLASSNVENIPIKKYLFAISMVIGMGAINALKKFSSDLDTIDHTVCFTLGVSFGATLGTQVIVGVLENQEEISIAKTINSYLDSILIDFASDALVQIDSIVSKTVLKIEKILAAKIDMKSGLDKYVFKDPPKLSSYSARILAGMIAGAVLSVFYFSQKYGIPIRQLILSYLNTRSAMSLGTHFLIFVWLLNAFVNISLLKKSISKLESVVNKLKNKLSKRNKEIFELDHRKAQVIVKQAKKSSKSDKTPDYYFFTIKKKKFKNTKNVPKKIVDHFKKLFEFISNNFPHFNNLVENIDVIVAMKGNFAANAGVLTNRNEKYMLLVFGYDFMKKLSLGAQLAILGHEYGHVYYGDSEVSDILGKLGLVVLLLSAFACTYTKQAIMGMMNIFYSWLSFTVSTIHEIRADAFMVRGCNMKKQWVKEAYNYLLQLYKKDERKFKQRRANDYYKLLLLWDEHPDPADRYKYLLKYYDKIHKK